MASARDGFDAMLLERAVHCMEYVAQLASMGLRFVFKGGTACQLLLGGELQRLSIDVDIATDAPEHSVLDALDGIRARMGGMTYAYTPVGTRGVDGVPLRMFNITAPTYYPAQSRETMVKLDVVLHAPRYQLGTRPLRTFYYESDIEVPAPTPSSMLGDKMSTLGPSTIGLSERRVIDNLKQFYDIGNLLGLRFDVQDVERAYASCFDEVSRWRELDITIREAHADLEDWCKVASALPHRTGNDVGEGRWGSVKTLGDGLGGFSGYIRRPNRLSKRRLRDIASRTALLSRLLSDGVPDGPLYDYVREPRRFQGAVVSSFQTILDGVASVPREERWHVHIPEVRNSPLALAAWYGYWDPNGLDALLGSG